MNSINIKEKQLLEKIIFKFINYLNINTIYNCTNLTFDDIQINSLIAKDIKLEANANDALIICDCCTDIRKEILNNNTFIRLFDDAGFFLDYPNSKLKISIHGKYFDYKKVDTSDFKVLALINVYNEEDVIEQTVDYLINQGIDVYLLDNWSKDKTPIIINKLKNVYPNKFFSEKYPLDKDNGCYDWYHQLEKCEQICTSLNYNWYTLYDADEWRISPWKNVSLKEMIHMVDQLGFNTIENTVINFRLTNENQDNIFMKDTYFEFGKTPGCFVQSKTWKNSVELNLSKSGGHEAIIPNPKKYPLKILNKHYPFRTVKQASKKVFVDRMPRFTQEERDIGWHIQYDSIKNNENLINKNTSKLLLWDKDTVDKYYAKLFIDGRL